MNLEKLNQLRNTLGLIEIKAEQSKIMATCLNALELIISEEIQKLNTINSTKVGDTNDSE